MKKFSPLIHSLYVTRRELKGHSLQSPCKKSSSFQPGLELSEGRQWWHPRESLDGQLARTQAFLKFQNPLDLSDGMSGLVGPLVPSIGGSFKATSILPAMMEQAAAHPYSPAGRGATEVGWGLRALFCQQTHL